MTYKEFKNELEKLGLKFFNLNIFVGIKDDKGKPIYYVGTEKRYDVYPINEFYKLDESLQKKVFELVNELAKTSLDERGYLKESTLKEVWYGII